VSESQDKLSEKDFKDPYEFGFETDIESDFAPKGLNEDTVRFISKKMNPNGSLIGGWMLTRGG
jgi:Fe-S cluster assembly protein SufB